ncbi:MAG: outer membrane beta-barrel protein [Bacteroidetes bacterium]|nr:outer membrane beta-barrel protein [Bacteroidota bacterium]
MKKILLSAFCAIGLIGAAQENKTWRIGVQWGAQGNCATYDGGMSEANARFNQNKFGSGALDLIGRYDLNQRWMIMSGLGFHSIGFDFGIAENYSLLNKDRKYSSVKSQFAAAEIPVMAFYKFNPNCKNARWLVGAGFAETFVSGQTLNKSVSQAGDGPSNVNYMSSTATSNGGVYWMLRWSVAREKMYKNGSLLNASLMCNVGFATIAHATVNYTIDNQDYTHSFSNNGSFAGFRLTYFFKPLKSLSSPSGNRKPGTAASIN